MIYLWFFYIFAFLQMQYSSQLEQCIGKLFTSHQLVDLVYVEDQVELTRSGYLKAPFSLKAQQLHLIRTIALEKLELELWKQRRQAGVTTLVLNRALVDLKVLFELAWKYYLTNFIVVASNSSLFTYVPLNEGRCPNLDPVYLGTCKDFAMAPKRKYVPDFRGCTFKLPYLYVPALEMDWNSDDPGMSLKPQKELMKILKYKAKLLTFSEFGVKLSNGTLTGVYRALQNGTIDFVIGTFMNDSYMIDFDIVTWYYGTHYHFYAPMALNSVPWKNIFIVFHPQLWLAFFATFVLVVLSCSLLKFKEVGSYKSFSYCILALWRIIYSANCSMPKTLQLKLTVVLWIFAAFLLSSAYQAYMPSCLFIPRQGYQIDTLEKVLSSALPYGGSIFVKDAYERIGTDIAHKFARNFVTCSFLLECVDRVAEKRDFIVAKDLRSVFMNWKNYLDKEGKPKLYKFPSEASYMIAMYFRKGHPAIEKIQDIFLWFLQSGLLQKWDRYITFEDYAQKKTAYVQLKPEQLLAAFVMLLVGLGLASISFLIEIL